MYHIVELDLQKATDVNKPNEPHAIIGKVWGKAVARAEIFLFFLILIFII